MTRALLVKEARALLPIWVLTASAAAVAPLLEEFLHAMAVVAFGAGVMMLGAYSVGHEYVHRTIPLTLALPINRSRLFVVKLLVAAAMVLPLAAYASAVDLLYHPFPWALAACALLVAPPMTTVTGSPLAGAVISATIAFVLLSILMLVSGIWWNAPAADERAVLEWWGRLMVALCPAWAILGWRWFTRFELIERGGPGIAATMRVTGSTAARPSHPLWQLVKKELRLQHSAWLVVALFVALCAAPVLVGIVRPETAGVLLVAGTTMYWLVLPVVIGACATAQEREIGALPSQLLLPMPVWQQWAIKAATCACLAMAFGVGIPLLVLKLAPIDNPLGSLPPIGAMVAMHGVLLITSFYVSSASRSVVWAAVVSVAAIPIAAALAGAVVAIVLRAGAAGSLRGVQAAWGAGALLAIGIVMLVLTYVNHRAEAPDRKQIATQVLALAELGAVAVAVFAMQGH